MVIKPYQESPLLLLLRILAQRMDLIPDDKQQYLNLEKGHEGEQRLAAMLEDLPNHFLVLHDLLLESGNTTFQVDALVLYHSEVMLLEVKNFEGDFYMDSENFYTIAGREFQNPILQLNRSTSLFRQWLRNNGMNFPVKSHAVFTHPEFTLFQAPLNLPIILPTQLHRFIHQLKSTPSRPNHHHKKLAEKLLDQHITESPYERLPHYEYQQLKKGIVCAECKSLLTFLKNHRWVACERCGNEERVESSVLRSVKEFQLLFPDSKITTAQIQDWYNGIVSKKVI